jgi:hypothetical protein
MTPPLTGTELAKALGISRRTYQRRLLLGEFKRFEVKEPIGQRRYSADLVRLYLAGSSVVPFGMGSRKYRRAS